MPTPILDLSPSKALCKFSNVGWFIYTESVTEFLNLSKLLSKTEPEPLRPTIIILFPDAKNVVDYLVVKEPHCQESSWPFMLLILIYLSETILQSFFSI